VNTTGPELLTSRLRLRRWRASDLEAFAELNADPRVMEYFPNRLTREESDAMAKRIEDHFDRHGFGLWAVEVLNEARFIGFTGLIVPSYEAHFTPCVEMGWRLAFSHWGKGYAPEAARAALEFAFTKQGLSEVVSVTVPANLRSRSVMERIGMKQDPKDCFEHPKVPEGHPLRPHVLYRLSRTN
jgi:RimJ/RimL family protein N-acetyltransferase